METHICMKDRVSQPFLSLRRLISLWYESSNVNTSVSLMLQWSLWPWQMDGQMLIFTNWLTTPVMFSFHPPSSLLCSLIFIFCFFSFTPCQLFPLLTIFFTVVCLCLILPTKEQKCFLDSWKNFWNLYLSVACGKKGQEAQKALLLL